MKICRKTEIRKLSWTETHFACQPSVLVASQDSRNVGFSGKLPKKLKVIFFEKGDQHPFQSTCGQPPRFLAAGSPDLF
jgi:hypothetical protein